MLSLVVTQWTGISLCLWSLASVHTYKLLQTNINRPAYLLTKTGKSLANKQTTPVTTMSFLSSQHNTTAMKLPRDISLTKAYALVTSNKQTQSNTKPVSTVGNLCLLLLSTSCGSLPSQIHRKLSKMAVLRIVGNQPGNHYSQSGRTTL